MRCRPRRDLDFNIIKDVWSVYSSLKYIRSVICVKFPLVL